ncbi:hypothetical protein C8Q80DRAFT_1356040 [Daedaleopsis nitida]|nr:hypothetical protein C8Q80DRAFT_1356040 [Daedaleopsis nitida]
MVREQAGGQQLADRHDDCHCFADTRCQLAVAFQQARDYWAANPNNTEHAPSEIHQSIEQWLMNKNILEGPALTTTELDGTPQPEVPAAAARRRRSMRLPSLRPLRRLSLPTLGRVSESRPGYLRRRTESTVVLPSQCKNASSALDGEDGGTALGKRPSAPMSPKTVWRNLAVFRFSPSKKSSGSDCSDFASIREETPSLLDLASAGPCQQQPDELYWESAPSPRPCEDDVRPSSALGLTLASDAPDSPSSVGFPLKLCDSPESMSRFHTPTPPDEYDEPVESGVQQPPDGVDPAYRALHLILQELDTITASTSPRHTAIAEEFHDEGYAHFWETFAQLSPKEILYAVYAIRAGALDVPAEPARGCECSAMTALFALWAIVATAATVYLYRSLP